MSPPESGGGVNRLPLLATPGSNGTMNIVAKYDMEVKTYFRYANRYNSGWLFAFSGGAFKMTSKNALSRRQVRSSGFDDSAYEFNYKPGEFTGTIDCKRWGKGKKLVTYMTFEDGRKIAVLT